MAVFYLRVFSQYVNLDWTKLFRHSPLQLVNQDLEPSFLEYIPKLSICAHNTIVSLVN